MEALIAYALFQEREIDISDYLDLDPLFEDAGEIEGVAVFLNDDDYWVAVPGEEEAFEGVLYTLGLLE